MALWLLVGMLLSLCQLILSVFRYLCDLSPCMTAGDADLAARLVSALVEALVDAAWQRPAGTFSCGQHRLQTEGLAAWNLQLGR